ncbi:uncharacterized protein EI97DRAFT_384044 [Westerdykella ornata]|uniref:GPI-anchored cell wall organization protein Ecm33 n=1 Tax=Westerdykella ornata TaxID=318751 RepID=A0A6A6JDD1_WESOR|nr:uncharacterized protein EI97DRAFT_384044 [Westerdykella ornata]KAF2273199.1 hypothetical protein EI97DRAFT_384044 [Westerdykella ornata]
MSPAIKFALPMLAAAGSAYGTHTATSTIQNQGDATGIASCKTFSGSIAIKTDVASPINLDGVKVIDGSLEINNNSAIPQLGADSLEEITGDFILKEVPSLNSISMPKIKQVKAIRWSGLPNLRALGFGGPVEKADVVIIENTQLVNLEGLNLSSVNYMLIANNQLIDSIDMKLEHVDESLTITANSPELKVTFPNLVWAYNMTFRNCSTVEVPSVEKLNNSLNLIGNVFDSFHAPNLTELGGALAIVSNTELTNLTFPELTKVGANLQIANNTKLSEINGFPKLKTISGALDFNGNMSKIDIPNLSDVKGTFNIQSTGDVQGTCDDFFKPLKSKGRIQGPFVCKGFVEKPGGEGTDPKVTGNPKKTGSASTANAPASALLIGLAAAFFL